MVYIYNGFSRDISQFLLCASNAFLSEQHFRYIYIYIFVETFHSFYYAHQMLLSLKWVAFSINPIWWIRYQCLYHTITLGWLDFRLVLSNWSPEYELQGSKLQQGIIASREQQRARSSRWLGQLQILFLLSIQECFQKYK